MVDFSGVTGFLGPSPRRPQPPQQRPSTGTVTSSSRDERLPFYRTVSYLNDLYQDSLFPSIHSAYFFDRLLTCFGLLLLYPIFFVKSLGPILFGRKESDISDSSLSSPRQMCWPTSPSQPDSVPGPSPSKWGRRLRRRVAPTCHPTKWVDC